MARPSRQSAPLPWLTLLLACVFGVATWHSMLGSEELADETRRELNEAVSYLHQRPYLEVSRTLSARVSAEEISRLREAYEEARHGSGYAPPLPVELRSQQAELDDRVTQATQRLDDLDARRRGLNPTLWRPDAFFTYVPLHASWLHLGGCVALLLFIGLYLEPALGATRFAGIATLASLGAAAGYVFTQPGLDRVLIGSSGMLAGLLAVFLLEFFSARNEGFYGLGALCGLGWLAIPPLLDSAMPFDHPGAWLTGLAIPELALAWVYLGGATGGASAYGLMGLLGVRPPARNAIRHEAKTSTGSIDLDAALVLRSEGRDEAALKLLLPLAQREPNSVDAALLLADVASSLGQHALAEKSRLRVVRLQSKLGDGTGAVRHWLDLTQRGIPEGIEPALLVRMAGLLRQMDHPSAAATALQVALERADRSSLMVVAGRVARAAKEIDPDIAHDAAWTALGHIELPFGERQELEALLAQIIPKLPGAEIELSKANVRSAGAAPIEIETKLRTLDVVHAVPIDLDDEGVHVATQGGLKKRIRFERIEAVSVAGVKDASGRPVLVVDIVLNWVAPAHQTLRVIRLQGNRFDARKLVVAKSPMDALRLIVMTILERAEAAPLPDRDSVLGRPFRTYADIAVYARQVLSAEEPLSANPS